MKAKTSIAPMINPGSKRFCMNGSAANSWIPFQRGVRGSRIDDSSLTNVSRRNPLRQFFHCRLWISRCNQRTWTPLWFHSGFVSNHMRPNFFQCFESLFPPFRLHHCFARPFTLHQRKGRWGSTRPVNGPTPMVDEGISTLSMWYIIDFPVGKWIPSKQSPNVYSNCLAGRPGHTRPLRRPKHPLGFPTVAPAVDQRPGVFNKVFYSAPTTSVFRYLNQPRMFLRD